MAHKHTTQKHLKTPKYGIGSFCELYGDSARNRVLSDFLVFRTIGTPIADIIEETRLSKPTVYSIVKNLIAQGIVSKGRLIGRTQLYVLNEENPSSQVFIKQFKVSIDKVVAEYAPTSAESEIKEIAKKQKLSRDDLKRLISIAISAL